jgi:hypothetical protein
MDDELQRDCMTKLARGFPCLKNAPGVDPFVPEALSRWAAGPTSHGERITAQFLLAVWDPSYEWGAGKFDLMEALRIWPPSHREPFLRWAANPWWP